MSRRLHVLGGGRWQLPTIHAARAMGLDVLVTDMYEERPGYALADAHEVIDITDVDATLDAARRHRVDAIVCDTTDVGVPTAAYVAEKLGLPGIGYEVALNFTNKLRMRRRMQAAGLGDVRYRAAVSLVETVTAADEIGYPVVVKPVDSQSSRGVHRVDSRKELDAALADALANSRSRTALVEEFLPGIEATVEGMSVDGEPITLGISDKDHFPHRPEVANRLTYPAAFPPHVLRRISELNAEVVQALGLRWGVTHAEYMVDGDDVRLVEIAARGGGSLLYSHIAPHLSGIPTIRAYLEFLLGEPRRWTRTDEPRAANLQFLSFPAGRVSRIAGVDEAKRLPAVAEVVLEFGVGDRIGPATDDRSRPGFVLALGRDREEVLAATERAVGLIQVEVAP